MFVDDLDAPILSDADRHHLERVLRVRSGDALVFADGRGRWRTGALAADPDVTGPIVEETPVVPALTIGFALVKGDKPELIVQKLTELGIDRIVPFRAERSVVRWDADKAAKAVGRLRTVARAASMQCRRPRLPIVGDLVDLATLAQTPGAAMADRGGVPPTLELPLLLIGPEGGWSGHEQALDVPRVALGTHVLRAETAAVVAGAMLAGLRAGIVGPGAPIAT